MRFKKTAAIFGAAAMVGLAGPAFAGAPYRVSVGGNSATADHNYSAASKTAITFVVDHSGTPVNMGCPSATAAGKVHGGDPLLNSTIANIQSSTWTSCVGPGGLSMTVTQSGVWDIEATGGNTSALTDTITGNISGVSAHVSATPSTLCNFDVTGTAAATFHENNGTGQQLHVSEPGSGLTVSNVVGCLGLISNSDHASFTGNYDITSPDGAINVF